MYEAVARVHDALKRDKAIIFLDIEGAYDNLSRMATYMIGRQKYNEGKTALKTARATRRN